MTERSLVCSALISMQGGEVMMGRNVGRCIVTHTYFGPCPNYLVRVPDLDWDQPGLDTHYSYHHKFSLFYYYLQYKRVDTKTPQSVIPRLR